ncbi:protein phosphatase 2C domain-containing protein [Streptomyces evansiae]|uniref:protein phosphatase 2C domain-containing protein n=1 Tax=Streptomyces evansiae TaxID=3075535 RepID=UPI0028864CBF|nr:protein phosphatase 2C domain-containing protein [Streptomyces sp. DSM 41859]MDT0422582.1 protein phosphatase 2C domain-containing protein [Streptomyces sp. DSM 41859]
MARTHQLAACPRCAEPLDASDLYCGGCGYDLSAVPGPPAGPPPPADWPQARETDGTGRPAPVLRASDLPATVSDTSARPEQPTLPEGVRLPEEAGVPAEPGVRAGGGPRYVTDDRPAEHPEPPDSDYALAAPPPAPPSPPTPPGAGAHVPAQSAAAPVPPRPEAAPEGAQGTPGPNASAPGTPASGAPAPGTPLPNASPGSPAAGAPASAPEAAPDPRLSPPPPEPGPLCARCGAGRVDADGYCERCGHAQPRPRDHMERELSTLAAVSDRGLRHHRNEDAFAVAATALPDGATAAVAVVCDGVSSATRPDAASLAAAQTAEAALMASLPRGTRPEQAMREAIEQAAEAVNALADEPVLPPEEPGQNAPACTLVAAIVTEELLVVGWVGDSRVYWVPADRSATPYRLTEDDSWAAQMVAARLLSEEEAYADERAHAITGWLGADAYELEPHTAAFRPEAPGSVVVCTDGLWNYAESAEAMAALLPADSGSRPLDAARTLVRYALDSGGHDNITVAVVPYPAPGEPVRLEAR